MSRRRGCALVSIAHIGLALLGGGCGAAWPEAAISAPPFRGGGLPSECRFEYAVQELPAGDAHALVGDDDEDASTTSDVGARDGDALTFTAGDWQYTIEAADIGATTDLVPTNTWRVRARGSTGAGSFDLGEGARFDAAPRWSVGAEDRVLLTWLADFVEVAPGLVRHQFAIIRHGQLEARGTLRYQDRGALRSIPTRDGWYVFDERPARTMEIHRVTHDGQVVTIAELPGQPIIALGHDAVGFAASFGREVRFLRLRSDGGEPSVTVVDEDRALASHLDVAHVLVASDGWWIVLLASWQSQHYASAPPEWRFVHLDLEGRPTGRVHHRLRGAPADLRVVPGGLDGTIVTSTAAATGRLAIRARGPCEPAVAAPCTPRRWMSRPQQPGPRWRVERIHPSAQGGVDVIRDLVRRDLGPLVVRRFVDGNMRWERAVAPHAPGAYALATPYLFGQRAYVFLHDGASGLIVQTLDASDGRPLGSSTLARVSPSGVCAAQTEAGVFVALAGADGLSVYTLAPEGSLSRRLRIPGSWEECALGSLGHRIVLAAARVEAVTSSGNFTSLHAHVLRSDGAAVISTHSPPGAGGYGVQIVSTAEGAALVWSDSSRWHYSSWRLDRSGRPLHVPRELATLYHFPRIELYADRAGPAVYWSTWNEHGVVPLCSDSDERLARPGR